MNKKKNKGNEILVTNTGLYQGNGKILYIAGKQNAGQDTVGTIVSLVQAQGVTVGSGSPDTRIYSFTWQGELRQILVKITKGEGRTSTCTLRLLAPQAKGEWKSLSGDVSLTGSDGPALRSPNGMAQWGNILFFIDDETWNIVILGANELKGVSGNYTPVNPPLDLSESATSNAWGQAIIALGHKLFALYRVYNPQTGHYSGSWLYRLNIGSGGALAVEDQIVLSLNPQAVIPVSDGTNTQLLIPALGGARRTDGSTNGTESNIRVLPAFEPWAGYAPVKITGDPAASPPTAYDIIAIAGAARGPGSMVYILTQLYTGGSPAARWRLYRGTAAHILGSTFETLSDAVLSGDLEVVDEGDVNSPGRSGLYAWDLLYEQLPGPGDTGDRLWAALGTKLLAARAAAGTYGSPTSADDSPVQTPFVYFNLNAASLDLTVEAANQAKREVSLKRGMTAERAEPVTQ
jgi:hypothetical protein